MCQMLCFKSSNNILIWEIEEDLDCLRPNEGEGEPNIYEDDEVRVFHERGIYGLNTPNLI